jgi:AcrR family transcriptional regulator
VDLVTEQKLERRERILEAVRELIAERGYAGVTMRDLAVRSRVSVPTLYNQFGGKDGLLAAAVEGHLSGLLARASDDSGKPGHDRLLRILELCGQEMVRLSRYHRALLRAFMEASETDRLQVTLAAVLHEHLMTALGEMQASGALEGWVRPRVLADRITAACVSASGAWALDLLDDSKLGASMLFEASMLLLGVSHGDARRELERAARSAQKTIESATPSTPSRGRAKRSPRKRAGSR